MRLFLDLVLNAACSLRAASAVMKLLRRLLPALERTPTYNAGQMWLLRVGLFELLRPKEAADDWVWIADHSIKIGVQRCLLVVAVRLSTWEAERRPLEHQDLRFIALEPVKKSDGAIVYQQLTKMSETTGIVPRSIVSDEGTDLKGGVEAFCADHESTVRTLDIAHQTAKLVKHELEKDDRWAEFNGQCGLAKQRLAQTPLAHLLPPTPRSKARYMNLDELATWGRRVLHYLDNPVAVGGQAVDRAALQAKLGWLADHRAALEEWRQMMETVGAARNYVRTEGYHRRAAPELRPLVATPAQTPMSRRVAAKLLRFVRLQSAVAREGERLIGSSECIESLIGKGKRLEGQQSKSGFTKMVLAMAAAVNRHTTDSISQALAQVKTKDVLAWCKEHLGVSVQSQRRQALAKTGIKTG
jgi:hypothetical protein